MVNEAIELKIDSLAKGGAGVARHPDGFVVFIPYTCPGDTALVQLTKKKKKYAEGRLLEILEASPLRVNPLCAVFGTCGGCQWQHVNYSSQLNAKTEIVKSAFRQVGLRDLADLTEDCKPSPQQYNYRNRVQIQTSNLGQSGFMRRLSHEIVTTDRCAIASAPINDYLTAHQGVFPAGDRIEVFETPDGKVQTHSSNSPTSERAQVGFSQVNTGVNLLLKETVEMVCKQLSSAPTEVLDLYCGNGNFSFDLAALFPNATIEAVELDFNSLKQARAANTHDHLYFVHTRVEDHLRSKYWKSEERLILVDPPRAGLSSEVVQELLKIPKPRKLIYISCDPYTLARDVRLLLDGGFQISSPPIPFDMFPQTDHVESLVSLH